MNIAKLPAWTTSALERCVTDTETFATEQWRQQHSGHVDLLQAARVDIELPVDHRYQLDGGCKGWANRLHLGIRPRALVVCGSPV